jgi:hypothetical protein
MLRQRKGRNKIVGWPPLRMSLLPLANEIRENADASSADATSASGLLGGLSPVLLREHLAGRVCEQGVQRAADVLLHLVEVCAKFGVDLRGDR